jgi:riboflavin biosynthesis pyrimidine reductase
MEDTSDHNVLRIFPGPTERVPLRRLYLREPLRPGGRPSKPFVYTNFIASLDGRIALPDPRTGKHTVPSAIANPRDWQLFQQLAACADAILVSGRYVRDLPGAVTARSFPVSTKPEHADLFEWRSAERLSPQPAVVIVTASLELPPLDALAASGRTAYVATGNSADARKIERIESEGARVLRVGDGKYVEGRKLIEALASEGYWNIAMISGGEVLDTLLIDNVLDRLYLTLACRMLGGLSFETLLTGPVLDRAARFTLKALHYDAGTNGSTDPDGAPDTDTDTEQDSDVEQLFAIFDRGGAGPLPRKHF